MNSTANTVRPGTAQLEQAALWWLRLREPDLRPDEVSEWLAWCQRDAANLAAFEKIETLGGRLDALGSRTRESLARELLEGEPATTGPVPAAPQRPWRRRSRLLRSLALAAMLVVTVGLAFYLSAAQTARLTQTAVYATARAQSRDLELPDGSRVALGAATRLHVAYSAGLRDLQLADGEAYFEVAHNAQRPFVVHVGHLRVIAVGTAFNIRKTGTRIELVVTGGAVDVEDGAALATSAAQARLPNDGAIRVAAGQLVVADAGQGLRVRPADPAAATAWREGRLRFVDEDLAVVVANLNRYTREQVVIADASLGTLRYTGTILQGREAEWLLAIEKVFPVRAQHDAQGRIALYRRDRARGSRAEPRP